MDSALFLYDIDISNSRLEDLAQLADQAYPFYAWVSQHAQRIADLDISLNDFLFTANQYQIQQLLHDIYTAPSSEHPFLFDGVGRTYTHPKACYYFFSWLVRDAPQQRLNPIIQRIVRKGALSRLDAEIEVLMALILRYRDVLKTFSWEAIREVIMDRLEGSRRSIKGHEKEAHVRLALIAALQTFYQIHGSYGRYSSVQMSGQQIEKYRETYDIGLLLTEDITGETRHILIPIKTRETEGGDHAHLFTRDIRSAIQAAKQTAQDFLFVVIVAKNWSVRELENLLQEVDHLAHFDISPTHWTGFDEQNQNRLNPSFKLYCLVKSPQNREIERISC